MGSFDGAETCELVGSFLLNQLPEGIRKQIGLYRDDGLGAFQQTPTRIERIKKNICKVFGTNGLKITIAANKKSGQLSRCPFEPKQRILGAIYKT